VIFTGLLKFVAREHLGCGDELTPIEVDGLVEGPRATKHRIHIQDIACAKVDRLVEADCLKKHPSH